VIASGSLSHRLWPNKQLGPEAWTTITSEFNRQVDLRVLELWAAGTYREFIDMLPEYATKWQRRGRNGRYQSCCSRARLVRL